MASKVMWLVFRVSLTVAGFLVLFALLYPVFFIVLQSFYSKPSLIEDPVKALGMLTIENYVRAVASPEFASAIQMSLLISLLTVLVSVVVITPAAYAFSRFHFKGRDMVLYIYLILSQAGGGFGVVAVIALLMFLLVLSSYGVPAYGWHVLPLIYSAGLVPFQTWLLKSYFDNLPRELDEAAFIDGADWGTIIYRIVLPSSRPAVIIITLFAFMSAWGEFFIANLLRVNTIGAYIYMTAFGERGLQDPSVYAALSLIYAFPIIVIYMVAQRYMGEAYRLGIVKG
ncbi:binding-protein-dependent transport systems inner membrane component [Desulfurococcus mucosus DSM 2162]|uniref:Binding-protein-dependent transport systems inner membrane component n=1 Tax=Desulfurococcus mucosus (strain ATCC 35584 / DSM 2162 / JCM 9187 / O7/1) TaxID=765177 RepID=E8R711_DESM0|nr:ABC transporter permease subunit [Desulfurococcus mucosus]ADV64444.1 binding-protein-dependent transport systems inner membrane component [Desulfurococcus mucosus DSM 2162]